MIGQIKATGELINVEEYTDPHFGETRYFPMIEDEDDDRDWDLNEVEIIYDYTTLPKTPETKELIINEIKWCNEEMDYLRKKTEGMWNFIKDID